MHKKPLNLLRKERYLYGAVPVSERGQVVIPKEARDDLGIKPGDKLLVIGDVKMGLIALIKSDVVRDTVLKILESIEEKGGEGGEGNS